MPLHHVRPDNFPAGVCHTGPSSFSKCKREANRSNRSAKAGICQPAEDAEFPHSCARFTDQFFDTHNIIRHTSVHSTSDHNAHPSHASDICLGSGPILKELFGNVDGQREYLAGSVFYSERQLPVAS